MKLEAASCNCFCGIQKYLKGKSTNTIYIDMELDLWRYITYRKGMPSEHRGHTLFKKEDLIRFEGLPTHWWYYMNEHGEGMAVDFPLKIKAVLSWSCAHYYLNHGHAVKAARFPVEKICVNIAKRPCNVRNLMEWVHWILKTLYWCKSSINFETMYFLLKFLL